MFALNVEHGEIIYTSFAKGHEGEEKVVSATISAKNDGKIITSGSIQIAKSSIENGKALMVEQLQTDQLFGDLPTIHDGTGLPCDKCVLKDFCYNNYGNVDGKKLQEHARAKGWGNRSR
jgi:hypothetical protein